MDGFWSLIPKQKQLMSISRTLANVTKIMVLYFRGFSVSYCEILIKVKLLVDVGGETPGMIKAMLWNAICIINMWEKEEKYS